VSQVRFLPGAPRLTCGDFCPRFNSEGPKGLSGTLEAHKPAPKPPLTPPETFHRFPAFLPCERECPPHNFPRKPHYPGSRPMAEAAHRACDPACAHGRAARAVFAPRPYAVFSASAPSFARASARAAASRDTASSCMPGSRCPYTVSVKPADAWPSRSCTTLAGAPARMSCEA
jgi:hypothetical protein